MNAKPDGMTMLMYPSLRMLFSNNIAKVYVAVEPVVRGVIDIEVKVVA